MAQKQLNKVKTAANAVGFVALVLCGVIALNVIGSRVFARADFTQDKVYTLSKESKDLVAKIPDKMTVKAFISSDLQSPFSQIARYTRDLLDEYATASGGKLKWEVIDPGSDPKLEEEATKLKVPKMRRGKITGSKVEIGANYLGVAFQYGGNIESIPEISSEEGLEWSVSSIIRQMTVPKRKLAFASSEGELSTGGDAQGGHGGGLQMVRGGLKEYEIVPVQLTTGDKPIPDDAEALIIAGPKQPFTERAKFVVDQFLMKGKGVAFFVDGMVIEQPRNMQIPGMEGQPRIGRKNETGLDDLLEHYGFKVKDDLVLEPKQNVPGPVVVGGQIFLANYPTFIASTQIAEKHGVTESVKVLILPFASSLDQVKDKQPGLSVTQIATSTKDAWRQSGFFLYDPQNAQLKVGEDKGPFALAFAATGKLKSFFAGKPYPNEKGEKVGPPDPNVSADPAAGKPLDESTAPARILLVGDSDFISDEYLRFARQVQPLVANVQFFMNAVDWLSKNEGFAAIRAKGMQARPLTVSSDATASALKWGNIFGVPLAFIAFGIARWRLRESRRRNVKL